jgi:hypothetical protein
MAKGYKALGRDALLSTQTLKREPVDLPELGGVIWVRALSGKAWLQYNERIESLGKTQELDGSKAMLIMCYLISLTACDESGSLLFTEADAERLAENSFSVIERLADKALELSGLSKDIRKEVAAQLKKAPAAAGNIS